MKTTKTTTTRKNKFLRLGASALLLSILFVFVFAGVLSASFAVEEKAIDQGLIQANVAEAADIDAFGSQTFGNGKGHDEDYWNGSFSSSGSKTYTFGTEISKALATGHAKISISFHVGAIGGNDTVSYDVQLQGDGNTISGYRANGTWDDYDTSWGRPTKSDGDITVTLCTNQYPTGNYSSYSLYVYASSNARGALNLVDSGVHTVIVNVTSAYNTVTFAKNGTGSGTITNSGNNTLSNLNSNISSTATISEGSHFEGWKVGSTVVYDTVNSSSQSAITVYYYNASAAAGTSTKSATRSLVNDAASKSNISYTAVININQLSVEYYRNYSSSDATKTSDANAVTYDSGGTLKGKIFTRTGWVLTGWATSETADLPVYSCGQEVGS